MGFRNIIFLVGFITAFGGQTSLAETRVMTTTTDLADLVRIVGGSHVSVDSFCKANQDPHYVQTRPSLMVKLRRADLVVIAGLDLETGWLPLIIRGSRNPGVRPGTMGYLDLGKSVQPLGVPASVDASHGHLHPKGNPHYWLDPVRVVSLLPVIAERLSALDRANAATFTANATRFSNTLNAKITQWAGLMAPFRGTEVLSYHDTFTYFYARYGLVNAGTLENKPGIPPSPRQLSSLINKAKQRKISVIFHEAFHDKKPSGLVADRSGARLLILPVSVGAMRGTDTYIKFINYIINQSVAMMTKR